MMVGPRLYVTTGDQLPPAVWTEDKKEKLRQTIIKVRKLEGFGDI